MSEQEYIEELQKKKEEGTISPGGLVQLRNIRARLAHGEECTRRYSLRANCTCWQGQAIKAGWRPPSSQ